jgi:hypothetical protein
MFIVAAPPSVRQGGNFLMNEQAEQIAKLEAERDLWRAEAQRWRRQAIDLEGQIEAEIQRLQWRQHQLERGIKELKG